MIYPTPRRICKNATTKSDTPFCREFNSALNGVCFMKTFSPQTVLLKENKTRPQIRVNHESECHSTTVARECCQFWGNSMRSENSPDLNPTENLGAFVKERVERLMHLEKGKGRYSRETLQKNLKIVLLDLEFEKDLFQDLLCSMPDRFRQIREANGGEIDY